MANDIDSRMRAFLEERKTQSLYRQLSSSKQAIDFSSNDYLGLSKSQDLLEHAEKLRRENFGNQVGSTGSRLLNGHHAFIDLLEEKIADFHNAESALVFNSGYSANSGLLSTVTRKGDLILCDESVHASILEGIKLSKADSQSFKHNSVKDLSNKIPEAEKSVFVVTESVFSMDGSESPLTEMASVCKKQGAQLIVDEAHAFGVRGELGQGRCLEMSNEEQCFARVYTYGKAGGFQGASIVGSQLLKDYLINYCKTFIYTTAMSSHDYCRIMAIYDYLSKPQDAPKRLDERINHFLKYTDGSDLSITGSGPIFYLEVGDSSKARELCSALNDVDLDLRPIVSPTVPKGQEGIRIILHCYNADDQIDLLVKKLSELS